MEARECKAEHIAVGSEILLGQIANGHARTISTELADHGFFLYYHSSVGDNFERIVDLFRLAGERSNTVIVTGGLGPTGDDLTKEALAAFLHRDLVRSQSALKTLEGFFNRRGRKMPEQNKKQADCIAGGELLDNPNGTAPGQYVYADGVHYFLLPGPPLEMVPMLKDHVLPRLSRLFPGRKLISRVLHFCGIGESTVDEQITDLSSGSNPTLAPLASEGEMLLRITAYDEETVTASQLIQDLEAELRRRFGPYIYGIDDESLPIVVGTRLRAQTETLALAESCTGGLISSMITQVPGSSEYFRGGIVAYNNAVKENVLQVSSGILANQGAVSDACAREMAQGVRHVLGTTYGVSVTGIAGPDGGTPEKPVGLVYGAISSPTGVKVIKMLHSGSRQQIQVRTAKRMLWELWRASGRV